MSIYKNIARLDIPQSRTHGWQLQLMFQAKRYTKFFSDRLHGGREQALKAAIQFRDKIKTEFGIPTRRPTPIPNSRNKTGVIGIQRKYKQTGGIEDGHPQYREVFEVTWQFQPNKTGKTSVSIGKYGEEEAFRRAYEIRKAKEREFYGDELSPRPWKEVQLQRKEHKGKTGTVEVYEVEWRPQADTLWKRTISITEYGEEEAFRQALELKQKKERQILASLYLHAFQKD